MKRFFVFIGITLIVSCGNKKLTYNSPQAYDLNAPTTYTLPGYLVEISGIAFHRGNRDTIYAEQDERGTVYSHVLGTDYLFESTFKNHGDFEDLAICEEEVIMLRSDGVLFTFPFSEVRKEKIENFKKWKGLLPEGEFESLYADNETHRIYALCKRCKRDKGKNRVSGYIFKLTEDGEVKPDGSFKVDSKEIAELTGKKKIKFKSSAITFNRWTQEWYLLSNVNKMLVITDKDWRVKAVYHLDPHIYMQPEGIAFDNNRTLFISSEGSKTRSGRIFEYPYDSTH